MIDFQRDFVYPGGFGESLGNDTSFLLEALPAGRARPQGLPRRRDLRHPHPRGPPRRPVRPAASRSTSAASRRSTSATRARWAACWSAASTATTSSRRSTRSRASRSSTSRARARSTPPTSTRSSRTASIRWLIVCGVTTEVCVQTSVREANDRGYDSLVLSDATGSYFPEFQRVALEMIKAQGGIFGWVSDSAAFLDAPRRANSRTPSPRRPAMRLMPIRDRGRRRECDGGGPRRREGGSRDVTTMTGTSKPRLWVPGDWNAFFGLGHERPAQRPRAVRACPVRGGHGQRHRLRADPAGAGDRAAAGQPVLRVPGLSAGAADRPRRRHGHAVRPERPALLLRDVRDHAADRPARRVAARGLDGRSGLGVHRRRDHPHRRVHRSGHPPVHARAPRCSARWPASRSRSSRCARRSRCSRCRGSRCRSSAIILLSWTAGVRMPGGVPGGLLAVVVGTVTRLGRLPVRRLDRDGSGGRQCLVRAVRHPPADPRAPRS